ncbi:uncharacterized protein LOC125662842 isoform X2 [Ostrea edulis]|uniref:uncharacterized protein LOC125662842 isoform X2 n=1 Tax=Ostrea edulis TaxID=37623 RepID=UPI0024AFA413|nr:uncharacterized protein LOC125662842 isoform X2 [Ostrea edulis]
MSNRGEDRTKKSDRSPFSVDWLNSCYQQTLLPDAPWHGMEDKISQSLASKVEKQFGKPERKEALLQILGELFVEKYLPKASRNPQILELPNMSPVEKQKIMKEASAYLNSQMYKCVKEKGLNVMLGKNLNTSSTQPSDYEQFLQHTYNIFLRGMEREEYRQENELAKQKLDDIKLENKLNRMLKIPAPSRIKPATAVSSVSSAPSDKPNSATIRTMVHKVEGDPPPLWGPQSDLIGRAVQAILQRDPRKFEYVAGKMHGRQLPGSLRTFMWSDVLFREERKKMPEANLEKIIRERFAKAVSRGVQELRVTRATNSPIAGLVETAVIETYHKTTSMVAFKSTEHMREASRVLNILYVYDRTYEPYLVHWLFPLQIAFQNSSEKTTEKGEHVYEVAMYLDLLNSSCFPTWPQVFAIAEQVMMTLSLSDPDLYTHLKSIAKTNMKVNKKEFLMHLISSEKAKAEELLKATPGSKREEYMSNELLADPLVFIRRWIGEGFVSVLDTPAVMYIWDQCFMQGWQPSVLKHTSLAILELLREKFMNARDYSQMKEVFLRDCCKLYTVDVQMAWIHLENGKDLLEIPYLNRQRPSTPGSRMSQVQSAPPTPGIPGFLNPCGVKDIILRLIIPSEVVEREQWLTNVDADGLQIHVHAYFGSVKLRSRLSMGKAVTTSVTKDNYGNTIYEVHFYEDKFVFDNLDISELDVERELGAFPYAIVRVEYRKPGPEAFRISVPLGWARIPLFQRASRGGRSSADSLANVEWSLQDGDFVFTIHPGALPQNLISSDPVTPPPEDQQEDTVLGYNSELVAIVYDPRREPEGRARPVGVTPIPTLPAGSTQIPPLATHSPRHSPVQRKSPRPKPAPRRTPVQKTPQPQQTDEPWVEPDSTAMASNPMPTGLSEAFDFYIDSVRFIPDNSSMIKVTGLIKTANDAKLLLALPMLTSQARSPQFEFKLTVNEQNKKMDADMVIFLRVYTENVLTDKVSVIGSCFVPVFKEGKLNVGGQQLRLRNGIPPTKTKNVATDLDSFPAVPACSILVRLLPTQQGVVPIPPYSSGYYFSEPARPTVSEQRVFSSYKEHYNYPQNVREMIQRIQQSNEVPVDENDDDLLKYLQSQLDIKRLGPKVVANNLPLSNMVRYRVKMGLNAKVVQAYGLPDGYYVQCFVRVSPGEKVLTMEETPEGYGKEEKFVTLKHDYDSFQTAPKFRDDPKSMHPFYDNYSCLIIQIFGLDLIYRMKPEHDEPGTVHSIKNGELALGDEQILAWTVVPMFEGNCVASGTHEVPLFKGKPPAGILEEFSQRSAKNVIQTWKWEKTQKMPNASMTVLLWDGHFELEELPEKSTFNYLLEAAGTQSTYQQGRKPPPKTAKKISNFVVDNLEQKHKKLGTNSSVYTTEQKYFDDLITKTFYNLMVNTY